MLEALLQSFATTTFNAAAAVAGKAPPAAAGSGSRRACAAEAIMRNGMLLAFFATACVLPTANSVNAAGPAVCNAYADAAVKAAQEVRQRDCGGNPGDSGDGRLDLNHPQWSTDRNAHMRWCREASEESVNREADFRAIQLGNCKRCDEYSAHALSSAKVVRDLACTYDLGHPQWSGNRGVHMKWCMAVLPANSEQEKSWREEGVLVCRDCANYVKLAVGHSKENSDLKCGHQGPRWDSTPEGHMNWCINEENRGRRFNPWVGPTPMPSRIKDETNARAGAIAICKQTKNVSQGLSKTTTAVVPSSKITPQRAVTGSDGVAKRRSSSAASTINQSGTVRASPCRPGKANDPCKPKPKALNSGILETGGALGTQGPAATGTPLQTSSPQLQRGSGGGGAPGLR